MAPTFKTGKGTRVLLNSRDLSQQLNDAEAAATVDLYETTCYMTSTGGTQNDKTYAAGHRDGNVTLSGLSDIQSTAVEGIFRDALQASTDVRLSVGPGGSAVGDHAIMVVGPEAEYTRTSPAAGMVAVTAKVQATMERFGYWLISPAAAITSTGSQTGITDAMISTAAGTSAFGGIALLHVVSATTSTGAVKVQHSTDGASWADLITINVSSGRSVTRSTVSGSVKERIRGNVNKVSPAGFTVGLTFCRHLTTIT